jgi:hypothetical protein
VRPEQVQDAVMAMRNDAYRAMTGKDAPPMPDLTPPSPRGIVLGQRVSFDYADIIYRQQVKPDMFQHPIREPFRKKWLKTEWVKRGNIKEGIICGVRTLSDGTIDWSFDEPVTFYPETYFPAYIVAFDLRRKPVHLLPADVTVLP